MARQRAGDDEHVYTIREDKVRASFGQRATDGRRLLQLAIQEKGIVHEECLYGSERELRVLEGATDVVDAGDYDGDGQSEILLKGEDHNYDSYLIFVPRTGALVSVGWHYH